jgi:hypothetical protein
LRTGTWRARGIAWGIVLAWHALLGWWLLHALPPMSARGDGADALQVVYVTLPSPARAPPRTRTSASSRRSRHAGRPRTSRQPSTATTSVVAVVAEPGIGDRPDLFEQGRALVRQQGARGAPAMAAFADRPARLPQADAGRFRMRDPMSPARVVAWLGSHTLAPRGYERDPCPRNRRNIGGLLAAGDSSRLQLELEFERRHCRP